MLVSSIVALLATAPCLSRLPTMAHQPAQGDRAAGRLVFLPLLLQKKSDLTNAENILTVGMVNYDSKMTNYGSAADPFPIIKNLRKNINKVTDEELPLSLTDALSRSVTSTPVGLTLHLTAASMPPLD
ncbi:hypothetical protein BASA61_002335 [Batrachochytrium salamandrivorans]|nr:hypothetical protein BASA61_002335 [Batrachochytrium salamandrivorans]